MDVAVLGLGRMGQAIAARLLAAGHDLRVWNRSPGHTGELVGAGARAADSIEDALAGAEVALTSLTGDDAVRAVLLPAGRARPEAAGVVLDCSSVAPEVSRALGAAYPGRFVACPVAGAPATMRAGQALLLAAGDPAALDRLRGLLADLAEHRHDLGTDPGRAAEAKLLNNYLLLTGVAALADAVAVGQAAGFADDELGRLLADLPVLAPGLAGRVGGLLGSDHEPAFTVALGRKDLGLFEQLAAAAGARPQLAGSVRTGFEAAERAGLDDRDLTAVIEPLRRRH